MSKLNPLYIVGLLIILISVLYIKVGNANDAIMQAQDAIAKTKNIGDYLVGMKREFDNKQEQIRLIKGVLSKYNLSSEPHSLESNAKKVIINIVGVDSSVVSQVTSKLLNTSLHIAAYEVEDNNFSKTIRMEFKL